MDDEEMVGDIACQMLDFLGYDAVWVTDGDLAVEEYRTQRTKGKGFAAVILDLSIPGGMGGEETVTKILAIDEDAKVFVSSGYANDPIMTNYKDHGFVGVLAKPFDLETIEKVVVPCL